MLPSLNKVFVVVVVVVVVLYDVTFVGIPIDFLSKDRIKDTLLIKLATVGILLKRQISIAAR